MPGVNYVNIVTKYDELVRPYTSGIEDGMTNIVLQDYCKRDKSEHFQIAADRNATIHVLNALDPANPRPLTCMLVLPFVGGSSQRLSTYFLKPLLPVSSAPLSTRLRTNPGMGIFTPISRSSLMWVPLSVGVSV